MATDNLMIGLAGGLTGVSDILGKYYDSELKARQRSRDLLEEQDIWEQRLPMEEESKIRIAQASPRTASIRETPEEYAARIRAGEEAKAQVDIKYPKPSNRETPEEYAAKIAAGEEAKAKVRSQFPQATDAQGTTGLYANRLEQSGRIIDKLEGYAEKANPISFAVQKKLPDVTQGLKSDEFQSIEQAQKNFLNATLRRESGAVISPSEFLEGAKQYFPMPGDSKQVIEQKRKNRQLVTQQFIKISGPGYSRSPLLDVGEGNGTTEIHNQALEWANAHPDDPRSAAIKQKAIQSMNGK